MKRYNKFVLIVLLTTTVFSMSSCMKDDDGEKRDKEKAKISTYVKDHNITVTPTASGLYYISDVEGYGTAPTETDFALIKYNSTDLDGNYDNGTDKTLADLNKVTPYFILGGPLKIYMQGFMPGVTEGLLNMKEGGKATMIMPSSLSYNDYVPRIVNVELLKVIKDPDAYEREQMINFLDTAYHKSYGDSTSEGIYYIEKLAGTGTVPSTGKYATIKYKGYLPDGRIFDQTEGTDNLKFHIGYGEVLTGLESGVKLIKAGGKATIVIPYKKGYGLSASGYYDSNNIPHIVIPYFSTLVFDVELVSVTDN
jgi:FKBP-type peptidyl-prolyl cis-trans isomerase